MTITERINAINDQIASYCDLCNRNPKSVQLLAVSKTKPATDIAIAYRSGLRHFGENYCQESIGKQRTLGAFDITWHFIGPIQSNKTKLIANHFDWVHSVESLKIASRLSEQRLSHLPPLNICLQVNVSGEDTKSGINLQDLPQLYQSVMELPHLKVRGVMAIPAPQSDFEQQRLPYQKLVSAVKTMDAHGMDAFSIGMTDDLKAAIFEGSTIVRIGTAIFGQRHYSK